MYFSAKLASLLLAVAASTRAAVIARHNLAEVSVVFYSDANQMAATFSDPNFVDDVCNNLPGPWLDRPESVVINPAGASCKFYVYENCAGVEVTVSGTVNDLALAPYTSLYNNIESYSCTKN